MPKKSKMSIEKFLETYNGAPYDDLELASCAANVKGEIGEAALAFMEARKKFYRALDDVGYEVG